MRIPVSVIVGQIAHGASFEEILDGYPDLEREDIQQALEYAAWLTKEEVYPLEARELRSRPNGISGRYVCGRSYREVPHGRG